MQGQPSQREYWSGKAGDEWASHAERIDAMLAPIAEEALGVGAFRPGERVLDIGCGAGATSIEIARRVGASGAVVGVDLSPQLLRVARERASKAGLAVDFMEADAGAASFGQSFNAAFSRFGVMFFEAPAQAFAHIRAAMRADGRLAFVCWRSMAENGWATTPIAAVEAMLKAPLPPADPDAPGPYAFADGAKVERILREAGWRNIALSRWEGGLTLGGGGTLAEIADFLLRIGPCARAIAEQSLDTDEARRRLMDALAPHYRDGAVMLPAACWLVTANA
ncbi:MAG: class I SAM-dependent methyltransferase [Caulobacteraceae bacterium]